MRFSRIVIIPNFSRFRQSCHIYSSNFRPFSDFRLLPRLFTKFDLGINYKLFFICVRYTICNNAWNGEISYCSASRRYCTQNPLTWTSEWFAKTKQSKNCYVQYYYRYRLLFYQVTILLQTFYPNLKLLTYCLRVLAYKAFVGMVTFWPWHFDHIVDILCKVAQDVV